MAAKNFGAVSEKMDMGETLLFAADEPLNPEENLALNLMIRKISSGYYDDAGRYYKAGGSGSGQRTDAVEMEESAPAATAAPAAAAAAPSAATSGSGVTVITTAGFTAPSLSVTRVQPGDLITAGFVNGLIDALLALDSRLRAIETRPTQTVTTGPGATGTTGAATGTTPGQGTAGPATSSSDSKKIEITRAAATLTPDKKTVIVKVAGHGLDPDELNVATIGDNIIVPSLIKGSDRNIEMRIAEQRASFAKPTIQISRRDGASASARITTKSGEGLLGFFR